MRDWPAVGVPRWARCLSHVEENSAQAGVLSPIALRDLTNVDRLMQAEEEGRHDGAGRPGCL